MIFLIGIMVSFFSLTPNAPAAHGCAGAAFFLFALPLATSARYLSAIRRAAVAA